LRTATFPYYYLSTPCLLGKILDQNECKKGDRGMVGDEGMAYKDGIPLISIIPIHPPISFSYTRSCHFGCGYAAL